MANLPHGEGDLELPIIEDLPFATEVDIAKAEEEFIAQYGDLLASVEVEDIGLTALIQSDSEQSVEPVSDRQNEEQTIAYPPDFSPAVLAAISGNVDLDLPASSADPSEPEQETILQLQIDEPLQREQIDEQRGVEELETLLQLEEESAPSADLSTLGESETLLQLEELPFLSQADSLMELDNGEASLPEITELPTLLQAEEESVAQIGQEEETDHPPETEGTIEELETLLQLEEETQDQTEEKTEELVTSLQPDEGRAAEVAEPEARTEELETFLQLEEETRIQQDNDSVAVIEELETLLQLQEETSIQTEEHQEMEDWAAPLQSGEQEAARMAEEEPPVLGIEQEDADIEPLLTADVQAAPSETMAELETLLQSEGTAEETPASIEELENLLQEEEGEPVVESAIPEEEFLPPDIVQILDDTEASLNAVEEKTIDELENLIQAEEAEDWLAQEEELPEVGEEEAVMSNAEQEDNVINYEEDEESAISEILTAFQTEGKSYPEEMENEDEEYAEEEPEYQYQYDEEYQTEEVEWEAALEENHDYQEEAVAVDDDYAEWQSGITNNEFPIDEEDEDSIIDEIITTFQMSNENTATKFVEDEEADALLTKWQHDEEDLGGVGELIDWEKAASGKMSALDIPLPDFESFTATNDPMETAIKAKKVLEQSKSSIKEKLDFDKEEQDTSLPPLPPVKKLRTEIKPPPSISMPTFTDEFEEERYQPRSGKIQPLPKRKDGVVLEDDSDISYRSQIKGRYKDPFADVEEDDWDELLDDIPPVSDEIFGVSEQTAARYQDASLPPQFDTRSFAAGDTEPANLPVKNPSHSAQAVSQTAPTFPERLSPSVRLQQFWENNSTTIIEIAKRLGVVLVPLVSLWLVFSHPRVNKTITVTTLRTGIWKDARGRNLRSVVLKNANLENANLAQSDLSGSDLGGVNLRKANLQGAKLEKTNLRGARLNLADLNGANLKGANLENAELSKTNFRGANLAGAKLGGRKWAQGNPPLSDKTTTCPNGKPGPCRF
ncbi:MAG: pentapeptide repeat-containing protein [Pseudanabaenaceae cyanobacterium]